MVPNCVIRLCLVEVLTKALTVESMAKVDYREGYEMVSDWSKPRLIMTQGKAIMRLYTG